MAALLAAWVLAVGPARAEPPNVVASIAPVHSLVASVMLGVGSPRLLVPAGANEHDYALRPSDMRAIAGADLVVWVGESLESYLLQPIRTEGVAELRLLEVPAVEPHPFGPPPDDHGSGHDHAAGGAVMDPHVWLDPLRAKVIVLAVAEALAERDAAHSATYRRNAAATAAALDALHAEIALRLAPLAGRPFVTFHDGYAYFVRRYGLAQAGQMLVHEQRPGAATVQALRATIAEEGVACAFAEPQFDADALRQIAGDTDLSVGTLDALGAALEPGPDLYAEMLMRNVREVEACLSSSS